MLFLDTESIGLTGPTVLVQVDDVVHHVWSSTAAQTLNLIERLCADVVVAYNLSHDWFHIQRLHNILSLLPPDKIPTPADWLRVQRDAVNGPCVKPKGALDLYLYARKGPMQTLMERDPIRVRRVPAALADALAQELNDLVTFPEIFHAGWKVSDYYDAEFPDVVLRFRASLGLKPLCRHLFGVDTIDLPIKQPDLPGWNPYDDGWLAFFDEHVAAWRDHEDYARQDTGLLRRLVDEWQPEPNDDDSILACQIGSSRWRGYALDLPLLETIRDEAKAAAEAIPERNKHAEVKRRLNEIIDQMDPFERTVKGIKRAENSNAATLKALADKGIGYAKQIQFARSKEKEADQATKLLIAGRFHPDIKVIGALSGRMAGAGGLNAQGISSRKKGSNIRDAFVMADDGWELQGGDFKSFQVVIAAAVWNDDELTEALKSGKKFHGVFGASVYDMDYDDLLANEELYGRSKNAVFATMFGAQIKKQAETLALPEAVAEMGMNRLKSRFPGIKRAEEATAAKFTPMFQPTSGGPVYWREPAPYVDSIFGYRRYFTLENQVVRGLFDLAQDPPASLRGKLKVTRRAGREQTAGGALQSALFGAAFSVQARNARCAKNHEIQAPEATIAKRLQRRLWGLQPCGISPWRISLLPVHDEMVTVVRDVEPAPVVEDVLEEFRPRVPLIGMSWKTGLISWGALK